ncbi:MAG: TonB-dependent receptor [Saprospiraceae bacterium]|nr:TonB-dependent receptor [Saprospiraceae bacterium]
MISLRGRVMDGATGDPISGANIYFPVLEKGTSTDLAGFFRIDNLPSGIHRLSVTYLGYAPWMVPNIVLPTANDTLIEIELVPTTLLAEEVIITATQKRQSIALAPASIEVISFAELAERNVTTFDQALDAITGVQVTRSSEANVQTISIRGASEVAGGGIGNRVLLLIDGRPALSPESGGALWNLVPLAAIDRIEVVKGAYSSLYGSSAMGGVINVLTKRPAAEAETRLNLQYGFYNKAPSYTQYDRFSDFSTLEISHSKALRNVGYLINASRKSNDGHREKSGYELYNLFGKVSYNISQQRSIQLSANANLIDNDTPATWLRPSRPYNVAAHRRDDFQKRNEYNADLIYSAIPNGRMKYSSRLYYYQNYSRFIFDTDPANDSTNVNFGKQSVARESIRAQRLGNLNQYDIHFGNSHYLIAGTDLKYDHILGLPDTVLYGRHKAISLGLYAQDEINLSEKVIATVGLRYDYYSILNEFSEGTFSPKVAFVYTASPSMSLRLLLAQAFRNPSMAERFIKFEQGGGLRFQPNPNLKAEKLDVSLEVGILKKIRPNLTLDAALFYNHYQNLISFEQVAQSSGALVYRVINLNRSIMQGAEVNLTYAWQDLFEAHLGYTYLDAQDISENRINDVLAYKAKHSISFGGGLFVNKFRFHIDGRYRSKIEEVFIYSGSEPDAYFLWSGRLSYQLGEQHSIYTAVENIGNTQYEELERYRMAGRNYTFGLNLAF